MMDSREQFHKRQEYKKRVHSEKKWFFRLLCLIAAAMLGVVAMILLGLL